MVTQEATDAIKTNILQLLPDDEEGKRIWHVFEDDFLTIEESGKHQALGTSRILSIVRSLGAFARHDEAEFQDANVNELINDTLVILANKVKQVKLEKNLENLPTVPCFASQLSQVFLNIINNAVWAAENTTTNGEDPTVWVSTKERNTNIVISISDNGAGIDAKVKDKLFDPFVTTKPIGEGTGMGLAISYKIISEHHGDLEAFNREAGGATFQISIPTLNQSHRPENRVETENR